MRYKCSWLHPDCKFESEDEHEEALLAAADEHVRATHPGVALDRDKVKALIQGAGRVA